MGLTEKQQNQLRKLAKKAGIKIPDNLVGYAKLSKEQIHKLDMRFEEAQGTPLVIIKKNGDVRIYTVEGYTNITDPSILIAAREAKRQKAVQT
jgi:hypothetical protein